MHYQLLERVETVGGQFLRNRIDYRQDLLSP